MESCIKFTVEKHFWVSKWCRMLRHTRTVIEDVTRKGQLLTFNNEGYNVDYIKELINVNWQIAAGSI